MRAIILSVLFFVCLSQAANAPYRSALTKLCKFTDGCDSSYNKATQYADEPYGQGDDELSGYLGEAEK